MKYRHTALGYEMDDGMIFRPYCSDQPHKPAMPPIVCLPLMRIPATPEKTTKYLPEVWKPT